MNISAFFDALTLLFITFRSQEVGGTLIGEDRLVIMAGVERYIKYIKHMVSMVSMCLMPFHLLGSIHY